MRVRVTLTEYYWLASLVLVNSFLVLGPKTGWVSEVSKKADDPTAEEKRRGGGTSRAVYRRGTAGPCEGRGGVEMECGVWSVEKRGGRGGGVCVPFTSCFLTLRCVLFLGIRILCSYFDENEYSVLLVLWA